MHFTIWESASLALLGIVFPRFIGNIGYRIAICDLVASLAVIFWLVVPIIFYHIYTEDNELANIWKSFMPIPSEEYYSYVFPATLLMIFGLFVPFKYSSYPDHKIWLDRARAYLEGKGKITLILLIIGSFSIILSPFAPSGLGFVFKLSADLFYVAAFYAFYSDFQNKKTILAIAIGILLFRTLSQAMFGELLFLIILTFLVSSVGFQKRIKPMLKVLLMLVGIMSVIFLQSIKHTYRSEIWGGYGGNKIALFGGLIFEKITDPVSIFTDSELLFGFAQRGNQGLMIAQVMDYIPEKAPFSNGRDMARSLAAVFIPRVFWPGKPEAGGKYNMKRYAGKTVEGYSMNISPVAEAYGNFGRTGGIVFMFFFGLFLNVSVNLVLKLSWKNPSLVLWIPYLFYYSVKVETDVLSVMNALVKGAFFAWLVYAGFRYVLKARI
ncbi:MAG: hypothetical protein KDC34_03770 [Saprospiraceae bacterium]|nr:hypothetical protein [Saprospiraceae bacterium]